MDKRRIDEIVKTCLLYYYDNKTQSEIAKILHISRPQVSRFLTYGKEKGIVKITIKGPSADRIKLEITMKKTFNLKDCILVDSISKDRHDLMSEMGAASGELLNKYINDNDIIGISAGKTLFHMSLALPKIEKKNIKVVPVCGGTGYMGDRWQTNYIIANIEQRWHCNSYQLNSPTFVSNKTLRDELLNEKEIKHILEYSKECDVIISGIGSLNSDGTLLNTGFLTKQDIDELRKKNAVVSICNSFLNKNGKEINYSGYQRMIGWKVGDFKKNSKIICYALGDEKIDAIDAALKSKYITALVTDVDTCKLLLKKNNIKY